MKIFGTFFLHLIKVLRPQKAACDICAVHRDGAMTERIARDWHAKCKNVNFVLKNEPRSGRPVVFDKERLSQHKNSRLTTRELAEKMNCSHTATEKHLHSIRKFQKCLFRML